jgi:hypothetical protein
MLPLGENQKMQTNVKRTFANRVAAFVRAAFLAWIQTPAFPNNCPIHMGHHSLR